MLQLVDLCFDYPTCALNLNLIVNTGERLALCGNSGIGKTTTLHLLAGLLLPSSGSITWHQRLLANLPFNDRPVALLTQTDNVFHHLTVLENIALGQYSLPTHLRNEFWTDLHPLIAAFELTPYLHHKTDLLSGGQRQRVALIRLISQRQKIWLLDEPFNGLDTAIKEIAYQILMDQQSKCQATIIFTTHHHNEIQQFASKTCYLSKINGLIEIHS